MNTPLNSSNRNGFIIVISLTLMLVMMTMGIGLYYSSKQSAELVGAKLRLFLERHVKILLLELYATQFLVQK
jgi:hypothetical protein